MRIDLGDREDTATVALPVAATVLGGPGADRVTAGDAADEMSGGEGNDALDGGGGDDVMSGDQGVDTLTAEPARTASRPATASPTGSRCGDGADTVDADTLDIVAADCESVTRTRTAAAGRRGRRRRPAAAGRVGAPTLQRLGRSRRVRVYATSSERGALSASGALTVARPRAARQDDRPQSA